MSTFRGILSGLPESNKGRNGVQYADLVEPGLIDGTAFRVYKRFAANITIKFVASGPFVLNSQALSLIEGRADLKVYTGGTEGGVFTPVTTNFSKNLAVSPAAVSTVTVSSGGTVADGTERDNLLCDAGTGGNAITSVVLGQGQRLLPAGTYYMDIVVTGTTTGIWAVEYSSFPAV